MKNISNNKYAVIYTFCIFLISGLFSPTHSPAHSASQIDPQDHELSLQTEEEPIDFFAQDYCLTPKYLKELAQKELAKEEKKEPTVIHNIGTRLLEMGLQTYEDEGVRLLKQAAEYYLPCSMFNLGFFYCRKGNEQEAISWYLKAITFDHKESMYNLGRIYEKNNNEFKAHVFIKSAAMRGDKLALLFLKDFYEKSEREGNEKAPCELGLIYYFLASDDNLFHEKAKNCFARRALRGCIECAYSFFQVNYGRELAYVHKVTDLEITNLCCQLIDDNELIKDIKLQASISNIIIAHVLNTHRIWARAYMKQAAREDNKHALLFLKDFYEECERKNNQEVLCELGWIYHFLASDENSCHEGAKNCFARRALRGCIECAYYFFQIHYKKDLIYSHEVPDLEITNLWRQLIDDNELVKNTTLASISNIITAYVLDKNRTWACNYLKQAVVKEPRSVSAALHLGYILQEIPREDLAIQWYDIASRLGHPFASLELGEIYERKWNELASSKGQQVGSSNSNNIPEDLEYYKKTVEYYSKAATQGSVTGFCKLGNFYYNQSKIYYQLWQKYNNLSQKCNHSISNCKPKRTKSDNKASQALKKSEMLSKEAKYYFEQGGRASCRRCIRCVFQIESKYDEVIHDTPNEKISEKTNEKISEKIKVKREDADVLNNLKDKELYYCSLTLEIPKDGEKNNKNGSVTILKDAASKNISKDTTKDTRKGKRAKARKKR